MSASAETAGILQGTPVVPGLAFGPVVTIVAGIPEEAVTAFRDRFSGTARDALQLFDGAVAAVAASLADRAAKASGDAAEVLLATAELARDKGLRAAVAKRMDGEVDLPDALHGAVNQFADLFAKMGGLMAERVTDLRDIEQRLLARIVGVAEPGLELPDVPSILVASDLAPADTAGLDPARVVALVIELGGPTSHTAIIARQLSLPCVVGVTGATTVAPGTPVLVNGITGAIEVNPDTAGAVARVDAERIRHAALASWNGPAATSDGQRIKVLANVADGASARQAAAAPVEGVGLFRTELCFLNTTTEPTVAEQTAIYGEVLSAFGPDRHVVVRTLDAGSDKPIAYATPAAEENPALGVRGLRLSFTDPSMLERQIEAIAAAAAVTGTRPWVMAPMVATVAEAATFAGRVRRYGLTAGVMVETPSAALLADRILTVVDFLSIGTNDLTQYTMAADRMATQLAHLTDPWQPAVLQLIAITARAGQRAGKPVGVCGEAAADPALAAVLLGLGITSLSMAAAAVRPVGAQLGQVTARQCSRAAEVALAAGDPAEARDAARAALSRLTE
ncbi:phosphotransferase system enzyme I (PtsI) [Actinoplanes campanulatus]|uniref:Phosphoenolpyruvate-protein phosphotransferase n=1 Tax=Actinoplanes campanulatus TaxID=113559 RepID=A0A7W5FCH7_9ACTN|nr:phosphoenolpyruvate--protein phosphotransferase [Actinoplanes campanulatus]MBB3093312.1 phosphotransferase system enzyme I (PtsI) [Actinoplanes campanulatus]GGN02695.1 phosphoenolpyruvate-protein phosphotransferase [Actinoplanes campanulatus]GID33593.1 phosphoenolpyruvate-protein phosphotransferase [Actinoplanes campanulatus]